MSQHLKILPECYGDTLLVELLGFKRPNHQTSGIGQVLKTMEIKLTGHVAVGVIDFDKKINGTYFDQFVTIDTENSLVKKKHPKRNHFLILLTPALEKFILKAAEDVEITPPFSIGRFKQISKTREAAYNQEFKQFLNRIIQKKAPGTETLNSWLREIIGDEP